MKKSLFKIYFWENWTYFTPYTKINSKWTDYRLECKTRNSKMHSRKEALKLLVISAVGVFLWTCFQRQEKQARNKRTGLHQTKSSRTAKETIHQTKGQPTEPDTDAHLRGIFEMPLQNIHFHDLLSVLFLNLRSELRDKNNTNPHFLRQTEQR